MHALEFVERQRATDRFEIDRLPSGHSLRTAGMGEDAHQLCGIRRRCRCERLERQGLQRIAGQKCGRLAEGSVACG